MGACVICADDVAKLRTHRKEAAAEGTRRARKRPIQRTGAGEMRVACRQLKEQQQQEAAAASKRQKVADSRERPAVRAAATKATAAMGEGEPGSDVDSDLESESEHEESEDEESDSEGEESGEEEWEGEESEGEDGGAPPSPLPSEPEPPLPPAPPPAPPLAPPPALLQLPPRPPSALPVPRYPTSQPTPYARPCGPGANGRMPRAAVQPMRGGMRRGASLVQGGKR